VLRLVGVLPKRHLLHPIRLHLHLLVQLLRQPDVQRWQVRRATSA
jgi:hypothetical protein